MNDLEITRLCAEAMGFRLVGEILPPSGGVWAMQEGAGKQYNPLHDDAQAMALVKKFNIGWDKEEDHEWHLALRDGLMMFHAHDMNLNRAICECVAKMQAAKEKT
jgi:hypothetical protein